MVWKESVLSIAYTNKNPAAGLIHISRIPRSGELSYQKEEDWGGGESTHVYILLVQRYQVFPILHDRRLLELACGSYLHEE